MDVLLATFQGVTIEALSTGHSGQVKVFEQLSLLVRTLAAAPPEFIAMNRAHTERALHNLVLGEFGAREGLMTGPFLELVREAFALLYAHGDSKDMLALAGEFQDAVSKQKKGMSSAQAAACMYALAGISRSKGKNLSGHLSDTVSIVETTLTPRSKQTLMKLASLAVSSMSSVSASSPALRVAVVEALVDGLIGALEAGKSTWPAALKVLTRASQVKSSVAVREIGVKGLIALASISPEPVDKLGSVIVGALSDTVLSVRMLAAEALGALIGQHRQGANWNMATGTAETGSAPKKVSLESLSWKTPLSDTLESLVHAFHASSSIEFKQVIARTSVIFLDRLPGAKSVDDIVAQIDWVLRFASSDQAIDKNENVTCASYIMRAGIGSRAPERLQLAAAARLIQVSGSNEARFGARRCALIELQYIMGTLGQGFTSLVEPCFRACEGIGSESQALLSEAAATLRALILAVPESSATISSTLLEALIMSQADVSRIERPVRALCPVIRAASSINRGAALPSTHLFGLGKALASRHLDQDSDPTGQFGSAGWNLIDSLLTLGPSFYSPHLMQLFALWQETLRSSKNESVLANSVDALAGLLRNANEDDFRLLGRATSSLLVTIPISFISKKSVRLQASVLDCWSKCVATNEALDSNMLLLALHHITAPDAKTSLLDTGGLLNPQDDVLEFDSDGYHSLSDGRPADVFMECHLFRVNNSATAQECRDCFDNCAGLHALVGRRARSRPSLGQRLKAAGGGGGGANSEATLPPADPRAIASGQTWAQRAVDASVSYFASTFARGDPKTRLEALHALIAKFGGIPHHNAGNASAANKEQQTAPKSFNVAACLLACMRLCAEQETVEAEKREIDDWQTVFRDFLLVFLASSQAGIRRAAAQALATFAINLASPEILASLQLFLEGALKSTHDDEHTNLLKCGALLASARMKREGKETFRFAPSEATVYDACKLTSQPIRVWSLHSWNLIVSSTNPSEAIRYVRPTMALVNAHLLTEAGSPTHESTSAHTATLLCLSRLCNTVVSCLGPELSTDEERATKLFSVWDVLRKSSSFDIQRQCVAFCELFALFHHKFIFEDTYRRAVVSSYVLDRLRVPRENLNAVFNASVTSVLRLCERDSNLAATYRSRLFESLERCGRAHCPPSMVVISPTLGSWGLRFAWAKSEMSGAAGPACSSRWSYFYPPQREEQICYVAAEMIRTGGSRAVLPWFWFCRDVSTGGVTMHNKQALEEEGQENDEDSRGKKGSSSAEAKSSHDQELEEAMREPRWQTKTVALEGLHAVVRIARTFGSEHMDLKRARESKEEEPLVRSLEALLSCAGQAATATVGDVGVMTLQARGLACLSRIVTIFAPQNDPDVPEFPLLRQYEAQLNATLRPGLGPRAQPELAREATVLAANVLITGVSTSARRLIAQLVFKEMLQGDAKEDEEEEEVFKAVEEEEDDHANDPKGFLAPKPDQNAFGTTVVDDVASSGLLLAKSAALARLALCAAGHASAAFEDDVAPQDQVFREDAQVAIGKALHPRTHVALVKIWLRIARDYFVLQYSSTLRAPRRHPDATYESGRAPQDVAALLPGYAEAWPVCAQAAAEAVDGPFWTLSMREFHCLVFGCARTVELEESPLRAIDTLTTLISKPSWSKLDGTFEKELLDVLALRAVKASQRGKKPVTNACLSCIAALLQKSGSTLLSGGGDGAIRLWMRLVETCVSAAGSRSEALDRCGLAQFCPEPLVPVALFSLWYSASKRNEALEVCSKAAEKLPKTNEDLVRATLKELLNKSEGQTSIVPILVFATATGASLSKDFHQALLAKLSTDVLAGPAPEPKRALIKAIGDQFRKGQVQQGRYYARSLSKDIFAFFREEREVLDTFKGVLEIWARIVVMGGLESEGLAALAHALAEDKAQGADEKRLTAWGKFFLLCARENPTAFKTLVARLDPAVKASLEETVRAIMSRS